MSDGDRMMGQSATLHMGCPRCPNDHLCVGVFDVPQFHVSVRVDGVDVPVEMIRRDYQLSEFRARLLSAVIGKEVVEITLSTNSPQPIRFVEIR